MTQYSSGKHDHPLTNPVNVVLAEFRSDVPSAKTYYEHLCWWFGMLDENVYPYWTPSQITHARHVLTRLANQLAH